MTHDKKTQCTLTGLCPYEAEILQMKEEISLLSSLVNTDILTGLFNYRHFLTSIHQEMERSQRTGNPTVLIMVDADHFKNVNDSWGHEVGNQALKHIANAITRNVRKLDIACRYGGEEFAIILPGTDLSTAKNVSERLRRSIENKPLVIHTEKGEQALSLTVSIGFCLYRGDLSESANKLVERADAELYRAKQSGRNQVCHSEKEIGAQQIEGDEKSALFDIFNDPQH